MMARLELLPLRSKRTGKGTDLALPIVIGMFISNRGHAVAKLVRGTLLFNACFSRVVSGFRTAACKDIERITGLGVCPS